MKQTKSARPSFGSCVQRLVIGLVSLASVCWTSSAYAVAGDSKATAVLLTMKTTAQAKTVTLVEDPEYGGGIYYFKVSLKVATGYTLWSTGASSVSAYMGAWDADMGSVNSDFSSFSTRDGVNFWMTITPEDWWDGMVSGTYYLVVSGNVGESFTLNWLQGVMEEPIPVGVEENPATISVGTTAAASSATLFSDGFYYYATTLAAGKRYKLWTVGGNALNGGFYLGVYPTSEVTPPDVRDGDWTDEYNDAVVVIPAETGPYSVQVSGDAGTRFTLQYQVVPARLPSAHPFEALGAPTVAGLESDPFFAGARNNPVSGAYDPVIDEQLFKVSLTKDAKYVFESFGDEAPNGLVMELYDATGKVLLANRHKAPGDTQTRIAFKAIATADYWVGVCQDVEEPTDPVNCTLSVQRLAPDASGQVDAWDTGDDTFAGALALAPVPGAAGDAAVTMGFAHGPHTLGLTDWADWFRIDARQDISYKIQTEVEPGFDEFTLAARIYTKTGALPVVVQTITNLVVGGEFKAASHGSYYIEVFVQDGQGVDYGPFTLFSMAYKTGSNLGLLRVNIGGPTAADGGLWSLVSDGATAPKYPGGATVLLTAGPQTVKFNPVTGWSTPANQAATIVAGLGPTVVAVNYNDTSDPKDDASTGATVLLPTNKEQKQSHSLWMADTGDWFKVTLKTDTYYSFRLEPCTGSPVLTVYRTNLTDVVVSGTDVTFLPDAAGTYFVKVAHAVPALPTDSSYTLNYLAQTVGTIKFEKATYSFVEGIPTADVKVLRSAKDGRVRVRYATVAGTAVPGVNYKPVKGYLEWQNNDSLTKTISVPLIPNLYATWEENKTFTVQIEVVPVADLDAGELVPPLAAPTAAAVTLTETMKKAPGKLGFMGYGPDGGSVAPFAVPAKPSVAVSAGNGVTFWVARTAGADGAVAVKAETVKGTALAGMHFEAITNTLVWDAGDLAPKPFTVQTLATGEAFQAEKALTVKLTVVPSAAGTPLLGASMATILVRDPLVSRTVEEWLAAADKPVGMIVKPTLPGTWFFDVDGNLRSIPLAVNGKAEITLALTGPGTLTVLPELLKPGEDEASFFKGAIGTNVFSCADNTALVKYLPKGAQTVKFTVTRGAASPADADVFGRFNAVEGLPFKWAPLSAVSLLTPVDKAIVGSDLELYWATLDVDTFRVYVATSIANLSAAPMIAAYVFGHDFCPGCGAYPSLEPGKTYYWRVDSVVTGEDANDPTQDLLTNVGPVRSFTVAADVAPETDLLVAGALAEYLNETGDGYQLIQGVSYKIGPFDSSNGETYKATGLPAGLSLVTVAGQSYITGIPTTNNAVTAILQASVKVGLMTVPGTMAFIPFKVAPLGLAAGAFNGLLRSDNLETNAHESLASINFTAAETGLLTAKVLVAGKLYPFTGSGYAEVVSLENGQPGVRAELTLKSVVAGVTHTNTLSLLVCRGPATETGALDTLASAALMLEIPAANALSSRLMAYTGELVRDNSKVFAVTNELAKWVGYYTVSLPVTDAYEGVPKGAGYVTVTLDAKGTAKLAGVLADATLWSAAGVAGYVSAYGESGAPAVLIPVYTAKGLMAASGWLVLAADAVSGLPVATGQMLWYNADPKSTHDGVAGFGLTLETTGGFYDTLFSLQTYYLNQELTVGAMTGPEQLDATYTQLICWPGASALTLNVIGNTMTTVKRGLVRSTANAALYDFENSTNACNVVFTFARATGLFSGTLSLWYGNDAGTLQRELAALKYQGVLTPAKHNASVHINSPGLGFCLIPEKIGTRAWTGSQLFEIKAQEILPDWSEGWVN